MSDAQDNGSAIALTPSGAASDKCFNVLSYTIDRAQVGVWVLECEIDCAEKPAPVGAQVLSHAVATAPPVTYACTVIEARVHIGRATVFAVAGAGGLRSTIGPLDYGEVRARIVVEDILRDAQLVDPTGAPVLVNGKPVSEVGDAASLAALDALPHLPRWSRPAGTARAALTRLVERLTELTGQTYVWRVTRAGTVWIGVEAWPAYVSTTSKTKDPPYYTEEPGARGVGVIALDAPDLDPGQTVQVPEDQALAAGLTVKTAPPLRISSVQYVVDEEGRFRALVTVAEPDAVKATRGRNVDMFRKAVLAVQPLAALRVPWRATVVSQDADGALGLRLEARAPFLTLSAVPYWPGLPGMVVKVPSGAQCIVEWAGGREDAPLVRSFAPDTAFTLITVGDQAGAHPGTTQPMARQGDSAGCGSITSIVAPPGGGPCTINYTPPVGAPQSGPSAALAGVITQGAPYFKGGS